MSIKTPGWPVHGDDELEAVQNVLKSGCTNYWTGSEGRTFEKEFAAFTGTKFAVSLMNGTVALEAALYALNIGPGDEVITSCRTFIASASCIVMRGATPVLADVDLTSQNLTAETIEACLTSRTKAIIVVHLAGWPANMDAISKLAKQHNLKIIEDCAQAHGASWNGRPVGSWGEVSAFSFCQDKIITTGGEGGMLVTQDEALWKKAWSYKDHGKNYTKVYHHQHPPGFRWLHDSFGTNWRMTEMQAAIGRVQLKKLPVWLELRKRNAEILNQRFKNKIGLRIAVPPKEACHAYYKYYVFVESSRFLPGWDRDRILREVNAAGTLCYTGSCSEIDLELAFKNLNGYSFRPKPNAKILGETSLMFLIHPTLSEADMEKMADHVDAVLSKAVINRDVA